MPTRIVTFALVVLFAAAAFGQAPAAQAQDRTLYFVNTTTPQGQTEIATGIRTIADVQQLTVDSAAGDLVIHATPDRLALAEWLFRELDQTTLPAGQDSVVHQYSVPGAVDDVVKVFHAAHTTTQQALTEMVMMVRTIAAANNVFPVAQSQAIAARSPSARMAIADWLFRQLDQPQSAQPTQHVEEFRAPGDSQVTGVFFAAHANTNQALTEMVTAVRTVADVNRMFPYSSLRAVAYRAEPDRVALGEWVFRQLDQPSDPQAQSSQESRLPGVADGSAMVMHLAHTGNRALIDLITAVRTSTGVNRIFPCQAVNAIAMRGTPSQIVAAQKLIQDRDHANE